MNLVSLLLSGQGYNLRRLTAAVVSWLDPAHHRAACVQLATWQPADWSMLKTVIFIHGIGPYLHEMLPQTVLHARLPTDFQHWLAEQHALNAARIQKMHGELHAILYAANRAGIAVMPLKGSLLGTLYYPSPALRPMSDLDLLVHPADQAGLVAILRALHYGKLPGYPDVYQHDFTVVSMTSEHPDNPRPVEVHTRIQRSVWDDAGVYEITAALWSTATPQLLLGEMIYMPALDQLLLSVTTHALKHSLLAQGRILQWLDIAYLAPHIQQVPLMHANWSYPVLRLASRALPSQLAQLDLAPLAARTRPYLRRWCESTPLDTRCGLMAATMLPDQRFHSWTARLERIWERWQPAPWRMAVVYENTPLPLAYAQYALVLGNGVARRVAGRFRR